MTRSRRRRAVDERPARCGPQANPRGTGTVLHAADSMMPGLSPGHGHPPPERCLLDQYVFTQMLLVSGDSLPPVQAELHYRLCDPFAVQLRMLLAGFDAVSWTFSRELLIAGISRPSGRGDIRICPGGRWSTHRTPISPPSARRPTCRSLGHRVLPASQLVRRSDRIGGRALRYRCRPSQAEK